MQDGAEEIKEIITKDLWGSIKDFLDLGVHIGQGEKSIDLTIGLLLLLTVTIVVTKFLLKWLRLIFTRKMEQEDKHKFTSVFKFINYVIYLIAVLVTLSAAGIFIIVDKSLQVGDVVEVDGKVGKVFEIKLRTTRAITRDDKVLILPNHKFISDIVYNYTQNHRTTREKVTVGVAYGSDVDLVTKILEEVANTQKQVLKNPKPFVLFEDFGDSALVFSIYFFTNDTFRDPRIKSEMRYKINTKFKENNVSIPFPQRDIHIIQPKQ
mgnify:CR=1 FL=1